MSKKIILFTSSIYLLRLRHSDEPSPRTDRRTGADVVVVEPPPRPSVLNISPARRPTESSGGVRRHCRGRRAGRVVQARRQRARTPNSYARTTTAPSSPYWALRPPLA